MFESLVDDEVVICVDLIVIFVVFRINFYGVVVILRLWYYEYVEFI